MNGSNFMNGKIEDVKDRGAIRETSKIWWTSKFVHEFDTKIALGHPKYCHGCQLQSENS